MKKILLFCSLILLTGCSYDEIYQPLKETLEENESNKFSLLSDNGYADEYGFAYYIEGTLKNNTDYNYSYVQITFNTYDQDGNIVGSCLDNMNNFDKHGTWKFEAMCSGDSQDVKSYKLKEITSW